MYLSIHPLKDILVEFQMMSYEYFLTVLVGEKKRDKQGRDCTCLAIFCYCCCFLRPFFDYEIQKLQARMVFALPAPNDLLASGKGPLGGDV